MPIARLPYVQIISPTSKRDIRGRYYHPTHMIDYTYEKALASSCSFEYIIPCHCNRCQQDVRFTKVQDNRLRNEFRREHFILAKQLEMKEIKKRPALYPKPSYAAKILAIQGNSVDGLS